ncbi:endolytic transglycosylase MltG [bacterium]|nr:endolytic transglycosylase MltG [bacterium]
MLIKRLKFIFALLIALFCLGFIFYTYQVDTPLVNESNKQEFIIEKGDSLIEIAENLEQQGLIKSKFWFEFYLKVKKLSSKLIADSFEISPAMSIKEIAHILTTNKSNFSEKTIQIIEGWNIKQIGDYLDLETTCSKEEWLSLTNSNDLDFDFLDTKPNKFDLEGFLFPDTYRIYVDASCEDIFLKMLNNFDKKLDKQMRKDIKNQGKTIWEIITMASLIEKEVQSVADMKIVSGLFWDRIKNKQALESCATLAYILGENKDQYSYEDTQINSAYNTYQNRGLPPGPITNPGINAIRAAIYPEFTNYNYFLTDPKTGDTVWSKNFEEHKQNKWKYLR